MEHGIVVHHKKMVCQVQNNIVLNSTLYSADSTRMLRRGMDLGLRSRSPATFLLKFLPAHNFAASIIGL